MSLAPVAITAILAGTCVGWFLSKLNPHWAVTTLIIMLISSIIFQSTGYLMDVSAAHQTDVVMEARAGRPGEGLVLVPAKVAVGTYTILTLPIRVFLFALLAVGLWFLGLFLGVTAERRRARA